MALWLGAPGQLQCNMGNALRFLGNYWYVWACVGTAYEHDNTHTNTIHTTHAQHTHTHTQYTHTPTPFRLAGARAGHLPLAPKWTCESVARCYVCRSARREARLSVRQRQVLAAQPHARWEKGCAASKGRRAGQL